MKKAHIIAAAIMKGGQAKTTTAINLAAGLHRAGHRVLLIDMDAQMNATQGSGLMADAEKSTYDVLHGSADLLEIITSTDAGYDLAPATLDLAAAEMELIENFGRVGSIRIMRDAIQPAREKYDFIIIDTPPSLGIITINALAAADHVIIPLQAEFFAVRGVALFMRTFKKVKNGINPDLNLLGILLTKHDGRRVMHRDVADLLQSKFAGKVFDAHIRTNVAISTAQANGMDVFAFEPSSNGAADYQAFTNELLKKLM